MSKPISSYPEVQRMKVAERRLKSSTNGLGRISAEGYIRRFGGKERIEKMHNTLSFEKEDMVVPQ